VPFRYEDGAYKFSDIDFTKYRKLCSKRTNSVSIDALCKYMGWAENEQSR
jgi:hypothetical protein